MLSELLQEILLTESVSVNDIDDAIDNHKRIVINYHSNGEDVATGARVIEVYAYGLTKSGNPVIRAFQPYGDTTSRVPSWKFFRLDRISAWKETNQRFSQPASDIYKGLGDFNPDDDLTMSTVYKIATFGNEVSKQSDGKEPLKPDGLVTKTNPKLKPELFKTDTEKNMERLRQQVLNPIKLSNIKTDNGFKNIQEPSKDTGPKLVQKNEPETYKTDTERGMEKLRQQLQNPRKIDLDGIGKPKNQEPSSNAKKDSSDEINNLRNRLGNEDKFTIQDLNSRLSNKKEPESYKTDTERNLEKLRNQLNNPRKIDLSKIPKR